MLENIKILAEIRGGGNTFSCDPDMHFVANNRRTNITIMTYNLPRQITEIQTLLHSGHIVILRTDKDDVFGKISPRYHASLFYDYELLFCPLRHVLVPKHRPASRDEIRNIPSHLNLPIILSTDVVCRWSNFSPDSIIAIEREDGIYFRLVK